jgi:hypothetical protein
MIPIQPGNSETCIALRFGVKFHFRLDPEHSDLDFFVAAHLWAPSFLRRNYKKSKGNRPSRQFNALLRRAEAGHHHNCPRMEETINNFESCMKRAGVSILRMDERRLQSSQFNSTQ